MLNTTNYLSVQNSVMSNFSSYMSLMIYLKSTIQKEILTMLSPEEILDIQNNRLNVNVINSLTKLGKKYYQSLKERNDCTLYCVCMAIGTIIKEYDWGSKYVQREGMCEIAASVGE